MSGGQPETAGATCCETNAARSADLNAAGPSRQDTATTRFRVRDHVDQLTGVAHGGEGGVASGVAQPPVIAVRVTSAATPPGPLVVTAETWPVGRAAADAGLAVTAPAESVDGLGPVVAVHAPRVRATAAASGTKTCRSADR